MRISDPPERHVELPNVFNLRDLGGYLAGDGRMVAWRRLFRADGLQRLAPADIEGLHELGLRTVIDLRRPEEVEAGRLEADRLSYHHHPLQPADWLTEDFDASMDPARYLADRYLEMTSQRSDQVAAVLRLISDVEAGPLVFHCAAGKDRTGVVAALALSLLGVSAADIETDYSLSTEASTRWLAWAVAHRPELAAQVGTLPSPWTSAPPEAIRYFLADLRAEYGSVEAYVTSIGVGADRLDAMRAHLLAAV